MKIFIESQKFTQPLVFIGLSVALIVGGVSAAKDWDAISEGNTNEILSASFSLILLVLISLLFLLIKLKTRIDEKGVYYKFSPIYRSYKFIPWNTIQNCYVRKYNAITEFGGWGLRFSFFRKNGKAFTVKGSIGLQLKLKNGEKILIGTQQKDALLRTIETYQNKFNKEQI